MTRRGMTLVEMLVALTATLLLMTAIAQAFSAFGSAMSDSRAVLDLDGRMRSAAWRLRSDLAGATARPLPPLGPDAGEGYLEIIEGPNSDTVARNYFDAPSNTWVSGSFNKAAMTTAWPSSASDNRILGDEDDVLLLTTRSTETPFIGRAPGTGSSIDDTFESTLAEVGWFARPTPNTANPVTYTLYRKQLLVMGYVGADPFHSGLGSNNAIPLPKTFGNLAVSKGTTALREFYNLPCDVSVRREGNTLYPNTLADLTRRETRFMHNPIGTTGLANFPFSFVNHQAIVPEPGLIFDTPQRQGEDVVLTNVIAFDVRVFDPGVSVSVTPNNTALVPGDPGFANAPAASGGYVDIGHMAMAGAATNSLLGAIVASGSAAKFAGYGQSRSGLAGSAATRRIYDTWSLHYEANGLDEDGDGVPDEGTNGLDDDGDGNFDEPPYDAHGDGIFDDLGETETLPPYPVPLRGIEVRIRCYEPSSRQVRQVTIRHTFVPH